MISIIRNYLLCLSVGILAISLVSCSSGSYSSHKDSDKELVSAPSAYAKQVKRDDQPKFSIGLGTLSPSYTQKLGPDGKTQLDFNTDKNGFSYSISNVNHQSLTQSGSENKATKDPGHDQNLKNHNLNPYSYYQNPGSPNINVYHQQGYSAYPQQVNALAQIYGGGAPAAAYNQPAGPGLLPFAANGQTGGQYYGPGQPGSYPGPMGGAGFFGPGQGFTQNISPNQVSPTTAASSTKPEAKEDTKASTETTTTSPTSGQLNTLPGGIFNYGFSQSHGMPGMQSQSPVNYPVNPMNYQVNPYFGATGGPMANQANMNGASQTAINHGPGAAVPGANPAGGMYGSPYGGFGMDPYSMAAMSGYGGGPGGDAYSGYGGYGGGSGLGGGSGMMGSASSPYASLFPFL